MDKTYFKTTIRSKICAKIIWEIKLDALLDVFFLYLTISHLGGSRLLCLIENFAFLSVVCTLFCIS